MPSLALFPWASFDTQKPTTKAPRAATAKRGKVVRLYYQNTDASPCAGTTTDTIKAKNPSGKVVKTLGPRVETVVTGASVHVWTLTVPLAWRAGTYHFSVYATDKAGNVQVLPAGSNKLIVK